MSPISVLSGELDDVLTESYLAGTVSVTSTEIEAKVGGARLAGRELLIIHNSSSVTIYHGPTGVTTSTGIPILKNQTAWIAAQFAVYLIAASGSNSVVVQELS